MPISQWLWWKAWFRFQGPPGGLRDDFHTAMTTLNEAAPRIAEDDRHITRFLPPWRCLSDYKPWADFGEDAEPTRAEYSVE